MVISVAIIYYRYNEYITKTYYEQTMDLIYKRFEDDIKRRNATPVVWAYLFDKDGNIIQEYKTIKGIRPCQ